MSTLMSRVPIAAQAAGLRAVFDLPPRLRRAIAGRPIRLDGQELALDAQLLLRMQTLSKVPPLSTGTPEQARKHLSLSSDLIAGVRLDAVDTRDLAIPVDGAEIGARLYTPAGLAAGSALLVFYHGGGFALGTLETHDGICRFLAQHAGIRVLSVDYRLAPEFPFPIPTNDAIAAFHYAHEHAAELGADQDRIAVGGDSAGGNLAAVTAQVTTRAGGPKPAFQLLFYPTTDGSVRRPSRDLFGSGFFLTSDDMDWFVGHYKSGPDDAADPRFSPLLAEDLSGLPPAYVATAGFDPLRDEGEAYAARMSEAGVPVVLSRQEDLIHGYINFLAVGTRFREAVFEAIGALRTGLAIAGKKSAE